MAEARFGIILQIQIQVKGKTMILKRKISDHLFLDRFVFNTHLEQKWHNAELSVMDHHQQIDI